MANVQTAVCTWSWWPVHACGEAINWGDVPTWLAAVAVFFAFRAFRVEQDRDELQARREIAAQAERVSAYVRWTHHPSELEDSYGTLGVDNRSDQPITDTVVYAVIDEDE